MAQERTDAGLEDCRRAQQLDGLKAVALSATAQAQLLLGRPREALAGFDAVLAEQPNFMRALYGRGVARQALGDGAGRDVATLPPPPMQSTGGRLAGRFTTVTATGFKVTPVYTATGLQLRIDG